jgi:stage II sporulation protein R
LFVLLALAALIVGVDMATGPHVAAVRGGVWQGEMIRLHVVARSDGLEDQRTKLAVRDALLKTFGKRLEAETFDAALAAIQANLPDIRRVAEKAAAARGETDVEVTFGLQDFPLRVYGGVTVPAGTYQALRVVIGGGEGRNWWCVMYPALCLTDADCADTQQFAMPLSGTAQSNQALPEPEVVFESALWSWVQSLFDDP